MILGLTKRLVVIDAETASPVDLKKCGAAVYWADRDTRTLMIGHEAGGDPVWELRKSAQPPRELAELATLPPEECMFAAFNAAFDHRALIRAGVYTPIEKWLDIALLAYALSFAGGLDDVLKQAGLKVQKNSEGQRLIQKFSAQQTPWYRAPEDWQKYVGYCDNDVAVERKLLDFCLRWLDQPHMHGQMRDLQRQWLMDWRTNERGLPVDVDGLRGALRVKEDEVRRLTAWMRERTGLDNPNSVSQLQAWCAANDAPLPNLQAATVRDYLAGNLMPPVQHVADVLTARLQMGKASVKKLDAFERRRTGDRLRGSYITLGASRTGRQASRGANLANLERPKIKDADLAAELLREGDAEQVRWYYGSDLMTVLGSSVRAMLMAPPGKSFCVYDFKSIESVGAAWLAGCDSILDIFFQGRDTYKTFASRFFGVPYDEVTDWQRFFSKPCFLGFGFGAAYRALQNYAHKGFNLEISDEDAKAAISLARSDYPEIPDLWYDYLNTAKMAVMHPRTTQWTYSNGFKNRRCAYYYDGTFLQCRIPSGRVLYYHRPGIEAHQPDPENNPDWVTQSLYYYGRLQDEGGKWQKIHTHGGSLLENCIAEGTLVLSEHRGWVPIEDVNPVDRLWDGVDFVAHGGKMFKGVQATTVAHGVQMTPDHLVLTTEGWIHASESERYNRAPCRIPDGCNVLRERRKKVSLGSALRLRERENTSCDRTYEDEEPRRRSVLRLQAERNSFKKKNSSRHEHASRLRGMAVNDRPLPTTYTPSMEELWWEGYYRLRKVANRVYGFLGRHGAILRTWFNHRASRQLKRILSRELPVGYLRRSIQKQTKQQENQNPLGEHHCVGSVSDVRNRSNNAIVPPRPRVDERASIRPTARNEQVWDIANCGPRNRFVVLGDDGPVIVHNCTQALCRDVLYDALERVDAEPDIDVVGSTYDEAITLIDWGDEAAAARMQQLMKTPSPWMDDRFFLDCDGYHNVKRYRK